MTMRKLGYFLKPKNCVEKFFVHSNIFYQYLGKFKMLFLDGMQIIDGYYTKHKFLWVILASLLPMLYKIFQIFNIFVVYRPHAYFSACLLFFFIHIIVR